MTPATGRASSIRIGSERGGACGSPRTPAPRRRRRHSVGGGNRAARAPAPEGHLPELLALGLGSLACAALARRAGLRRRAGQRFTEDPVEDACLSEDAVDAATLLHRFDGVPALHSFEAANCLLARSLDGRARARRSAPSASRTPASPFWRAGAPNDLPPLSSASRTAPRGTWATPPSRAHDLSVPYVPVVLPIGDDAMGTWLVPLQPGDVLPLLGEAAPALWRAARAAVGSWAWSETILVTEDPDDAALRAEAAADPLLARAVAVLRRPALRFPRASPPAAPWSRWNRLPRAT